VQDNVLSGQLEGKCHRNIPGKKRGAVVKTTLRVAASSSRRNT
jgi:hypothetical protein